MPKIKPFLFGSFFGACLTFVALRYHVVRYDEGVLLVPRSSQPPIRSAYVDIREWGAAMWKQYPEIATALVANGHSQFIAENVVSDLLKDLPNIEKEDSKNDRASLTANRETPPPIRLKSSFRTSSFTTDAEKPVDAQKAIGFEDISVDERTFVVKPDVEKQSEAAARPKVEASDRLRSAVESLFAPYEAESKPVETPDVSDAAVTVVPEERVETKRTSIPTSSIPARPTSITAPAAPETYMELQGSEVELGQPVPLNEASMTPRQAESGGAAGTRPPTTGLAPRPVGEPI